MKTSKQQIIARLILNTKRNIRINNLIEIANDINLLCEILGSIEEVSKTIGISVHMLNQFRSVFKLSKDVKKLVERKELDSVSVVNYISKYSEEEQLYLANEYINGTLNSQDIRAIGPLRTKFPYLSINDIASKVLNSKNIKVSVIYFQLSEDLHNDVKNKLIRRVEKVLKPSDIVDIQIKNRLGVLKVTTKGAETLRLKAKKSDENLKSFIQKLIKE